MRFHKPILAAMLGVLSTVAGEIISRVLVMLGYADHDIYQIASLIITANRYSVPMGIVAAIIVGGAAAIFLNYALSRFGADYVVIKATAIIMFVWFIFKMYSVAFLEGKMVEPRSFQDYYSHMAGALATGITLGLLFKEILYKKTAHQ